MKIIANYVHNIISAEKILKSVLIGDAPATISTESGRLTWAINASNSNAGDIHLALHSNAGGGVGVEGAYYSTAGKKLASDICNELKSIFTPRNPLVYEHKTFAELKNTNKIAAIIECGFHDNSKDVAIIHNYAYDIARKIVDGLYKYFDVDINYKDMYFDILTKYDMIKTDVKNLYNKWK
jgi:N-acetylmuramoyl-L-alanine amidase